MKSREYVKKYIKNRYDFICRFVLFDKTWVFEIFKFFYVNMKACRKKVFAINSFCSKISPKKGVWPNLMWDFFWNFAHDLLFRSKLLKYCPKTIGWLLQKPRRNIIKRIFLNCDKRIHVPMFIKQKCRLTYAISESLPLFRCQQRKTASINRIYIYLKKQRWLLKPLTVAVVIRLIKHKL